MRRCGHPLMYRGGGCCRICRSRRRRGSTKAARLEAIAAAMREQNLNHGRGCRTRAKAIAARAEKGAGRE
jgi:hypothetical protein